MAMTITKDHFDNLSKLVGQLTKKRVYVGIPAEDAAREPELGEKSAPATNALIAYVHEFGVPDKNIPARPFLLPGVRAVRDRIVDEMRKGGKNLLRNQDPQAVDKTMHTIGLVCQRSVVQVIDAQNFAPLSPVTLQKRKAKGFMGTKILIETGQLRQAVTYTVREGDRDKPTT